MAKIYKHLTTQERSVVMTMRDDLCSLRSIAKRLCRSVSTISRELQRTSGAGVYDANAAHLQCQARRIASRRVPKLHRDSGNRPLFLAFIVRRFTGRLIGDDGAPVWAQSSPS